METIGVLLERPMSTYLEQELDKRFKLFRFWNIPHPTQFFKDNSDSIRAMVGNAKTRSYAELIESLPSLEIVANHGIGLDMIDLDKCKERSIRVTNTPDVLSDDVADLAIGLVLSTLRRICACDRYVRSGLWKNGNFMLTTRGDKVELHDRTPIERHRVVGSVRGVPAKYSPTLEDPLGRDDLRRFSGKSVGIVGLGRIGSAIAKRAEAFGCPVSYYSRSEKPYSKYNYYRNVVDLASNCHILIVACALTNETRHIISREVINALGPNGFLINIGRGPLVDELELVSALVESRLGGAGLDVFEHEPKVPEQLFQLDNVVLLPHVGTGTIETRKDMADLVIGNLEAHFSNKPLLTPVV